MATDSTIEQLWQLGFDPGPRAAARAAFTRIVSPGFTIHNELEPLLSYEPPPGRTLRQLLPEDAPVCLALVNDPDSKERFLLYKTFIGRDLEGHIGTYVVQLLTNLPATFLARDAINLWGSELLESSDLVQKKELSLPSLPFSTVVAAAEQNELYVHVQLDKQILRQSLPFVLQAYFLHIAGPQVDEPFALFLGSSTSKSHASLIWALTHCLPRSLQASLTFSTYDVHVEDPSTSITGFCWPQQQSQNVPDDLPETCYAPGNLALNCDYPLFQSPLPPVSPELERYIRFAVQSIISSSGSVAFLELQIFLDRIDAREIATLEAFVDEYTFCIEHLPRSAEQLLAILSCTRSWHLTDIQEELFAQELLELIFTVVQQDERFREVALLLASCCKQAHEAPQAELARFLTNFSHQICLRIYECVLDKAWSRFSLLLDLLALVAPMDSDEQSWLWLLDLFIYEQERLINEQLIYVRLLAHLFQQKQVAAALPGDGMPFWQKLLTLLDSQKTQLRQSLWQPLVDLFNGLAGDASPMTHPLLWTALFQLIEQEPDALSEQKGALFLALLKALRNLPAPNVKAPFWQTLVKLIMAQSNLFYTSGAQPWLQLLGTLERVATPDKYDAFWSELFTFFQPDLKQIRARSWPLYERLLHIWGGVPSLHDNLQQMQDWLTVSWVQVDAVLALPLPLSWRALALQRLVETTPIDQYEHYQVIEVLRDHYEPLVEVFQRMWREQDRLELLLQLFAYLAQRHYTRKMALLHEFLTFDGAKDLFVQAFTVAHLSTREKLELFQKHGELLIRRYGVSNETAILLQCYFEHLPIEDIRRPAVKALLQLLDHLRHNAKSTEVWRLHLPLFVCWHQLAQFLDQPQTDMISLQKISAHIHTLLNGQDTKTQEGIRKKLCELCVTQLALHISTEDELVCVIEFLSTVLINSASLTQPSGWNGALQLLYLLALQVKTLHEEQGNVVYFLPYIKVMLGRSARHRPDKEKAALFGETLLRVFEDQLQQARVHTIINQLADWWPQSLRNEWERYAALYPVVTASEPLAPDPSNTEAASHTETMASENKASEVDNIDATTDTADIDDDKDDDRDEEVISKPVGSLPAPRKLVITAQSATLQTGAQPTKAIQQAETQPYPFIDLSHDGLSSHALTQTTHTAIPPTRNQPSEFVARVGKHFVERDLYTKFCIAEDLLVNYFIQYCIHEIKLHERRQISSDTVMFLRMELEDLQSMQGKLQDYAYKARVVVDNLIDDHLIKEALHHIFGHHTGAFDGSELVSTHVRDFKRYHGDVYEQGEQIADEDLEKVIRISLRRLLFARYLYIHQRRRFHAWLSEHRHKKHIEYIL